jgi:hypothetical protein
MLLRSLLLFSLILLGPVFGDSNPSQKFKQKEEETRIQMLQISRELGVTCTECHSSSNFKDNSKKSYQVGLQHMSWVQVLRENGMDGKKASLATCYTCHQGRLRFPHVMQHPE